MDWTLVKNKQQKRKDRQEEAQEIDSDHTVCSFIEDYFRRKAEYEYRNDEKYRSDIVDEYVFAFNDRPHADFYSNLNYYKKHGEFPEINYIQESRNHRNTYIQKYGYSPEGLSYEDVYRLKPIKSKGS
jgi:hypothetical protein